MVNSLLGADGCIRNDTSNWICDFSKLCGSGSSLQAKLWTIMNGLKLVLDDHYFQKYIVENDSQQTFDLLLDLSFSFHYLDSIILNCRCLFFKIKNHKIMKIDRQQNNVADALTKMKREKRMSLTIFHSIPLNLLHLHHEDMRNNSNTHVDTGTATLSTLHNGDLLSSFWSFCINCGFSVFPL